MKKINYSILFVSSCIVSGKLISFLFNAICGYYYGAGTISDAFIMAHSIPTLLFEGISAALITCYIPLYFKYKKDNPELIRNFNSNLTNISFSLSIALTVFYFVFRHQINSLYANGFDESSLALLDKFSAIIIWSVPFIGVNSILRAYLQVNNHKALSSTTQLISYSVLIIFLIVFFPNPLSLAWGTLFGNILCFIIFLIAAKTNGYKYKVYFSLKDNYVKPLAIMVAPIICSTLASDLASIVDKFFASYFSEGIVTSLTYGYQLSFAIQGIVSTSLLIVVYPEMSKSIAKRDLYSFNNQIYSCIEIITWIVLPLITGGIVLAHPLIDILFGHGNFTDYNVKTTTLIFSGYLLGVLPMSLKHVGDRACFALGKTHLAMIATIIIVISNIILDAILPLYFGYMGLVIATDISILIGCITVFLLIRKPSSNLSLKKLLFSIARPLVSCAVMGMLVFLTYNWLNGISSIGIYNTVLICICVGIISYFGISILLFKQRVFTVISDIKKL